MTFDRKSMASILGFSWSVPRAHVAVATALLGCAALSLPAAAQLGADDVAGIRLGASPAEIEAALKAIDPRFKFLTVYYADESGKASASVAAIKAAVQVGTDLKGIDWKRNGFAVYFGAQGKAYAIYRQVFNAGGISIPQTLADLTKKYGPSTGYYPEIYVRNTDAAGKATASCGGLGFGWQGGPGGFDVKCGQALKVQFDLKGPGVAASFQTWLLDHRLAQEAIQAQQAKQQAAAHEATRRQQDAVRGNRPAI